MAFAHTVAGNWEEFVALLPSDIPLDLVLQARLAFYAGAMCLAGVLIETGGRITDAVQAELKDRAEELVREAA